jgi:exo-beta-1,3-glucanase (GH17 family)
MDRGMQIEGALRESRGASVVVPRRRRPVSFILALVVVAAAGSADAAPAREEPFVTRPLRLERGTRWIGHGIAYGPHRDGQRPGGPSPSRAELRQDLRLMVPHWNLLRLYGSVGPAESLLAVIREEPFDMQVMLGVWIEPEDRRDERGDLVEPLPEKRAANRREVEAALRLARTYPDLVVALCVGNETQVSWSAHRVPSALLVHYLREVRAGTTLPVTTADDFNFWNKPESRAVAREVDFVTTHLHPLWNGLSLGDAVDWTKRNLAAIRAFHPGRSVILGETGWATRRHIEGEQARLMKGRTGEAEQRAFHAALSAWVEEERLPTFFFEAFDENWKGGTHPDEVEKHWGLFRADRTPKAALSGEGAP